MPAAEFWTPRCAHVVDRPLAAPWQAPRQRQRRQGCRCQQAQLPAGEPAVSSSNSDSAARLLPCSLTLLASVQPGGGGGGGPLRTGGAAATLLGAGTAAHAAMTVLGCVLGDGAGLGVTAQLVGAGFSLPAALGFILPLAGMCLAGTAAAERVDEFAQLKRVFQAELIPQLAQLPVWGLGLLALGAGVGEETLFRAFLQSAAIQGLAGALPGELATGFGLATASVVFGVLHALTPSYFLFALAAGFIFGTEYLHFGLQTAAATHFLYDWAALIFIIRVWGRPGGSGGDGGNNEAGPEPSS